MTSAKDSYASPTTERCDLPSAGQDDRCGHDERGGGENQPAGDAVEQSARFIRRFGAKDVLASDAGGRMVTGRRPGPVGNAACHATDEERIAQEAQDAGSTRRPTYAVAHHIRMLRAWRKLAEKPCSSEGPDFRLDDRSNRWGTVQA